MSVAAFFILNTEINFPTLEAEKSRLDEKQDIESFYPERSSEVCCLDIVYTKAKGWQCNNHTKQSVKGVTE